MTTSNHNQPIDPLIAKSHQRIKRQIGLDPSVASDEAWKDPMKIMEVGFDEMTARRVSNQAVDGLLPKFSGKIKDFSEIVPNIDVEDLERLEAQAKEAAEQSVLPKDYQAVGIGLSPFTRAEIHAEITGEQLPEKTAVLYDQERAERAA